MIKFALLTVISLFFFVVTVQQFNSIASGEAREKLAIAEQGYTDSVREVKLAKDALSKKAPFEFGLLEIAQVESLESKARLDKAELRYSPKITVPVLIILIVTCTAISIVWVGIIRRLISQVSVKIRKWSSTH